ncbi:MAG: hypothetical protein V4696_02475 [Pseudomonadota bacterium]
MGIIVIGVLIALAAQQWAEARSWTDKADAARRALRTELADHHEQAVEWRMVAPCIDAQLNALESRVLSKRSSLDPAPLHSEDFYGEDPHTFAIRAPSRPYEDSVWLATNGEGVSSFLATEERMELGWHYGQARDTDAQNERITQLVSQLSILTKPLELDPSVRMALLQQIAEARGHNRWMTIRTGQLLDHIAKLEMNAPRKRVDAFIAKSRTVRFCQAQRIKMLPVAKALLPAP